ncbi:hypothetical protein T09_4436 [Trichinella sp. T9]|nr:hypothetical protein T09_4436 [Trichinella sp. T9]
MTAVAQKEVGSKQTGEREVPCDERDKLLNRSSRIRVTAAPVSSRSWESVPATFDEAAAARFAAART